MTRATLVVVFVGAELWQFIVGAGSSLGLAAPGVGEGALWVPNVLVGETYTILPLGFILCLWGTPVGRMLAAVCAATSLVLAFAATDALATPDVGVPDFAVYFALFAAPGVALMVCVLRGSPAHPSFASRLGRAWGRLRTRGARRA